MDFSDALIILAQALSIRGLKRYGREVDDLGVVASKPESPITLVVRRGALRRFNKLQKETKNLPVVVTWDRRSGDRPADDTAAERPDGEDRRQQPSFTWELADFIVVPGDPSDGAPDPIDTPDEE